VVVITGHPLGRCPHQRQDGRLDRLGQVGPGGHYVGQIGVGLTGVGGQGVGNGVGENPQVPILTAVSAIRPLIVDLGIAGSNPVTHPEYNFSLSPARCVT